MASTVSVVEPLVDSVEEHLSVAEDAVEDRASSATVERVMTNLDAAEADALLLAPQSYLRGRLPDILALRRRADLGPEYFEWMAEMGAGAHGHHR